MALDWRANRPLFIEWPLANTLRYLIRITVLLLIVILGCYAVLVIYKAFFLPPEALYESEEGLRLTVFVFETQAYLLLAGLGMVWVMAVLSITLGATWMVWWLGQLIVRSWLLSGRNGNDTGKSEESHPDGWGFLPLFLAISAAVTLFGSVIYSLFDIALSFLRRLFVDVPNDFAVWITSALDCINRASGQLIGDQFAGGSLAATPAKVCFPRALTDGVASFSNAFVSLIDETGLDRLDVKELILALATFLLVLRVVQASAHGDVRQRFWVGYATIACAAIYLSLSATLSISLINQYEEMRDTEEDHALTREELATTLRGYLRANPPQIPTQQLAAYDGKAAGGFSGPLEVVLLDQLERELEAVENSLAATLQRASSFRESFASAQERLLNRALVQYLPSERPQPRTTAIENHIRDLSFWLQDGVEVLHRDHAECRDAYNLQAQSYDSLRSDLQLAVGQPTDRVEIFRAVLNRWYENASRIDNARRLCDAQAIVSDPPSARPLRSSLGVVGVASGWLVDIQSKEVTMVIGLIGFGLLGALISRFIVERDVDFEVDSGVQFAVVSLTGFAAALVVFVGAYGGLDLLAIGATEPNPYAVYALCLGAAAFSASVWRQLRETIERANTSAANRASATDDDVAAPEPKPAADPAPEPPPPPPPPAPARGWRPWGR